MYVLRNTEVVVQEMKPIRCIPIFPLVIVGLIGVWAKDSIAAENSIEQSSQIHLNKGVVYTIEGKKDPRLQATFLATYISTSKSEACSHQNPTTATRKVNIGSKRYPITGEHYRIEIPIYLEENENQCGYRFSRIELMLRRFYDDELYSSHILLDKTSKVHAIYYGEKTGIRGRESFDARDIIHRQTLFPHSKPNSIYLQNKMVSRA